MKKAIIVFSIMLIISILIFILHFIYWDDRTNNMKYPNINQQVNLIIDEKNENIDENKIEINDWQITLVNNENHLPKDFIVELSKIDNNREFDKRAIDDLLNMLKEMKKEGVRNFWVQSAYRSIELQQSLFDRKVNEYMSKGKSVEDAEYLTSQTINKAGTSEHNLGLAVDFNYVDYSFENTRAFKWLNENAMNYGFILRYRKDKEQITKVSYEPWHWRYVGVKHAKKINELNMCLEEYIEYLKT